MSNIAYKGTYNLSCLTQRYEVGQTYELDKPMVICESGFHFCAEAEDVFTYYPWTKNFKLLEIEVLGDVASKGDKSVTNKFKILGHLVLNKMTFKKFKFDETDNLIKRNDSLGRNIALKFDRNGNCVQTNREDGFESRMTFNKFNHCIYRKTSDGEETFYNYKNGLMFRKETTRQDNQYRPSSFSIKNYFSFPRLGFA